MSEELDHSTSTKEKVTSLAILIFFLTAAIVFTMFFNQYLARVTNENRTYNRFIACGLSVPAEMRSPDLIDECWDEAISDTGHSVKRYQIKQGEDNGTNTIEAAH